MLSNLFSRPATGLGRDQAGQALVLGAISLLTAALMVFMTLNVARAVHEKIRLQNHVDAEAYSMAVQEARTFNYFAYTNRALVNAYVGMATLHSYMSEAAMMSDADFAMFEAMTEVAAEEFAQCLCYWGIPCKIWHCVDAGEAMVDAGVYVVDWGAGSLAGDIKKLDSPFGKAMDALNTHIGALEDLQTELKYAMDKLFLDGPITGTGGFKELTTMNVYKAPVSLMGLSGTGVGGLNVKSFDNAIDTSSSNEGQRDVEMTSAVNATRPPFTWDRGGESGELIIPNVVLEPMIQTIKDQCKIDTPTIVITETPPGNALVTANARSGAVQGTFPGFEGLSADAARNTEGNALDSFDWGFLAATWRHGAGAGQLPLLSVIGPGEIITASSDPPPPNNAQQSQINDQMNKANNTMDNAQSQINGNDHMSDADKQNADQAIDSARSQLNNGGSGGSNRHRVDLGMPLDDPHDSVDHSKPDLKLYNFIDYNLSTNASDRFNQPVVYFAAQSDLRYNDYNIKGPWEITADSSITLSGAAGKLDKDDSTHGATGTVMLADNPSKRGQGQAVSKAMVYYHRFGDWQDPPNFFNPFWRAKMDSFDGIVEMDEVLGLAGAPGFAVTATAAATVDPGAVNAKSR